MNLNDSERAVLLQFLDELSQRFSCDGCNDLCLPNTPENKELATRAYRFCMSKEDAKYWIAGFERETGSVIGVSNQIIVDYLRGKITIDAEP